MKKVGEMNNFKDTLFEKTKEVEKIIYSFLPEEDGLQKTIMEAMNYSVKAGGKRLRPLFILETLRLFGGEEKEAYPFMAAMEMIHTYSLVHDDLPAMDNDDYRRGMETTHKKYGEAMGILAGDGLLNFAYETIAKSMVSSSEIINSAKAFKVLSEKSGIYGMVGGQTVDVMMTEKQTDKDVIDFIFRLKTGALIEASMVIGAILGGASEEDINEIEKAATCVGMAFQIQDDILDVTSTTEELGKPVLSDEKNQKTTYVTLIGIEKSREIVKAYLEKSIEIIDKVGNQKSDFLKELFKSLIDRKK